MTGQSGNKDKAISVSDNKSLVLVDSSTSFEEIKQLSTLSNIDIITFDYASHKTLLEAKITHEISDNYLQKSDLANIQEESYRFSRWYNESSISNYLLYEDINLGELFYSEFHYFIVPFLKKFVEIRNIVTRFPHVKFISSSRLYEIVKSLSNNVKELSKTKNSEQFLYDSVKIGLRVGNSSFSINLPQKYYLKIKTMSERVIDLLLGVKNTDNSKKNVLFVEFDTIKYKKIFENLPNSNLNAVFYGRRKPTVWNLQTFQIVKRAKCNVATYYTVSDKEIENKITNNIVLLLTKINSSWNQDEFFKTFFTIQATSFWESLKPQFLELCRKRMIECIREIELAKQLFKKFQFDSVVLWSESGLHEQIILKLSKKYGIPATLIQHGLYHDTKEAFSFNTFAGIFPFYSDNFLVWGESMKEYSINCGINENKIKVLGSPMHDEIFQNMTKQNHHEDKSVLLATSGPNNHFVNDLLIHTNVLYEEVIKKICRIVTSSGKKLVIKLHPSHVEVDVTTLAKKINPEITVIQSGSIFPIIESSLVVIVIDISTVIIESQILQKPVISISVKDYGFGIPTVLNSCYRANTNDFEKSLDNLLYKDDYSEKVVSMGRAYVNKYFSNQSSASEKLLEFLENI